MAKSLIENLASTWDPKRYHDQYRNQLLDLLEKKAEGEPLPEPQQETGGEVIDLMDALRQSVAATKKKRAPSKRKASTGTKKQAPEAAPGA
jgi:DNA end-binding protein Ku